MFAMEGPIVNNVAWPGIFSWIHSPASRPPGTLPVPAMKAPVVAGCIVCQLELSKVIIKIPPTIALSQIVPSCLLLENGFSTHNHRINVRLANICLLYTSDAADERSSVDLGGRRII